MNTALEKITTVEQNLEHAIFSATQVIEDMTSKNSRRAYQTDLAIWVDWCQNIGLSLISSLKKQHVIMFIMQHIDKHKIGTIKRRLASLSRYLQLNKIDNPCRDKDIRILMRKLTEKHGSSKSWGKAITLDILNDLLNTCQNDGLIGIRDCALLLFGFSTGGRRRSEISSAKIENLQRNRDGTYIYNLGKSKTNQIGEDDPKPIMGRAAMALTYWLNESGITEGSIFRGIGKGGRLFKTALCDRQIARIIKNRCKKAGIDENDYTAHSLRSGFVTEAGKRSKPLGDIMAMTGHKSLKEVMRYYKSGDILNNSAAYLAG